ncbi:hypothetical protein V6N13_027413 [Hibiscus sabdariffa]
MGSVLHLVNTAVNSVRATSVARGPKRTIQGRYEVCCPIQPKRARVLPHASSTNGTLTMASDSDLIAGKSSLNSPTEANIPAKCGTRDYFRFDSCWSKEDACIERVRSTWLHSPGSTVSKLQAIGDSLRSWQADRRVSSTKCMSELQGFLNSRMQGSISDEAKDAFLDAKREHKSLLDKDEAYWAQRARVNWLTQGDRNTAYFHARASGRCKKNRIQGLFNENGIWTDKQAEVVGVAMRYFTTLFSSSQPTPNPSLLSNIDHCTGGRES